MSDSFKWDDFEEVKPAEAKDDSFSWDSFEEVKAADAAPAEEESFLSKAGNAAKQIISKKLPLAGLAMDAIPSSVEDFEGDLQAVTGSIPFNKQIIGASEAALAGGKQLLQGEVPTKQQLLDSYYSAQKAKREKEAKAFENNPGRYMAASVGTGLSLPLPVGKINALRGVIGPAIGPLTKMQQLVQTSVGVGGAGALTGLTEGSARTMEGELGETAEEALTGVGIAGALGVAPSVVKGIAKAPGKLANKLLNEDFTDNMQAGFKLGKAGKSIGSLDDVGDERLALQDIVKNFREEFLSGTSEVGEKLNLKRATDSNTANIAPIIDEYIQKVQSIKDFGDPAVQKEKQAVLEMLTGYVKDTSVLPKAATSKIANTAQEAVESFTPTAVRGKGAGGAADEVNPYLDYDKYKEQATDLVGAKTGSNYNVNSPAQPNLYLNSEELASEALQNQTKLAGPSQNVNTVAAGQQEFVSDPAVANYLGVPSAEQYRVLKDSVKRSEVENLDPTDLLNISNRVKDSFTEYGGVPTYKTREIQAVGRDLGDEIVTRGKESFSPDIKDLMSQYHKRTNIENLLKISRKGSLDANTKAREISNLTSMLEGVDDAKKKGFLYSSQAMEGLKDVDPSSYGKLLTQVKDMNAGINAAKYAAKPLSLTRPLETVGTLAARGANQAGKIANKIDTSNESVYRMLNVAKKMGVKGNMYVDQLNRALAETPEKRTKTMFSLMQNPYFRQQLNADGDNE